MLGLFNVLFIATLSYVYIPSGMMRAGQKLAAWVCAERDINPIGNVSVGRFGSLLLQRPGDRSTSVCCSAPNLYPTACPGDVKAIRNSPGSASR